MDAKRQWLMSKQQIKKFDENRQKQYKHVIQQNRIDYFDDRKLVTYYVFNAVIFLHKRKRKSDYPFMFEKATHVAVVLYKRYRLMRSFIDEEPTQSLICAIYLGLKMCEFSQANIIEYAANWKQKPVFEPHSNHFHFGDQGYTEKELIFLANIGFQTGISPLISPIQSLYMRLAMAGCEQIKLIQAEMIEILVKVYLDYQLIFLFEGPKLALVIMILAMRNTKHDFKTLGQDIMSVYTQNKEEIQSICERINSIPRHDNPKFIQENQIIKLRSMTKSIKFKKPQIKKTASLFPRHDSLNFDKEV